MEGRLIGTGLSVDYQHVLGSGEGNLPAAQEKTAVRGSQGRGQGAVQSLDRACWKDGKTGVPGA